MRRDARRSLLFLAAAALTAGAVGPGAASGDGAETRALGGVTAGAKSVVDETLRGAEALRLGGRRCEEIAVPTQTPLRRTRCNGVRPGALVETPRGFCTMNFLFRDRDGRRYIGTAGHCVVRGGAEAQWRRRGPFAKSASGRLIGRFRYAIDRRGKDFALIRLKRGVKARSRMCSFGGPSGTDRTSHRRPVSLEHYGQGVLFGDVTPARRFLAPNGMPRRNHIWARGTVAPGDSGGPVTRAGNNRAVGLVVTTGSIDRASVGITRIPLQEARAEDVIGERLDLIRG